VTRWILAGALAAASYPQPQMEPAEVLQPGDAIRRPAVAGDVHRYEAALAPGDFLEISVPQDRVFVALSARAPDGSVIHSIDLEGIHPQPERLMFIASVSGRHAVDVRVTGYHTSEADLPGIAVPPAAAEAIVHVLALRKAVPDDRRRAALFESLERANRLVHQQSLDSLRQAIPLFQEAAAGWRAASDIGLEASTLTALAAVTGYFTQFNRESAAACERLTDLFARMGDRDLQIRNWRRLSEEYAEGGRLVDAKEALSRALALAHAQGLDRLVARARRQLGFYEFQLGNYEEARELAHEVQHAAADIADPILEAEALSTLARLDELAGDLDAAISRNRRALDLSRGHKQMTAALTMWLGFNHLRRGGLDEAASLFEARLAMSPTIVQQDSEALTRLGLADVALARGDRSDARRRYEAIASALQAGLQNYRCIAVQRVGRMDLEESRLDQARGGFDAMLQIATAIRQPTCEAEARAGLADLAARRGDLETADTEARRVVEITETFREAAISLDSRSLGFAALAPAYERAIDISMRRAERGAPGAVERGLALHEQALARGLLDRVLEARLSSTARVSTELAAERTQVREQWRARLAELQMATRTRPHAAETKTLADETSALAVRVRDVDAKIGAADPRQRGFLSPDPPDLKAIQAELDERTILMEYALGDARSYLWVVSARTIHAFTLPPRADIESLARRVHEGLARPPSAAAGRQQADEADRRALARIVLEPAAALLGRKRLVLVLPGALSIIPFGALPQPGASANAPPLIARHEIISVPSATILAAMRALTAGRARPTRTAAIFADPIFDQQDPRVRVGPESSAGPRSRPADAVRPAGASLTRLPFSRGEAEAIRSLAPGRVTIFLGPDATRERALSRALFDYRFIHFATHGIVNLDVSSLSSLVLSLVDPAGEDQDGFVMVPDIYEMTLNADVVVLSGCQTALGKHVRGEGPIGLARAFMYAGVPRVVASLWQVDDLATAELMKRFYRGMLVDELTPAAALRAAQRDLAAGRRWTSPYFWAPFVLQGDWH
jgi:CHAT domain-containing protein